MKQNKILAGCDCLQTPLQETYFTGLDCKGPGFAEFRRSSVKINPKYESERIFLQNGKILKKQNIVKTEL